ncbi:MAG: WD40 repeat domain-containing protein, partial [Gemmataceae bacterium]
MPCLLILLAGLPTALSPDGKTCAVAAADTVHLRDAVSGKDRLAVPIPSATALAFSPDGRTLAAAAGPVVHLFDAATGKPAGRLLGHGAAVRGVCFFPDGKRLVSGAADGQIRLWELRTLRATRAIGTGDGPVAAVAVSPDGAGFAAATREGAEVFD